MQDQNNYSQILLLCVIFVPFLGAFLVPLLGVLSSRLRNIFSLLFVGIACVCAALLIPTVISGQTVSIVFPFNIGFLGDSPVFFRADALAVFMAMVSSFIGSIIVFYSFGYISHYENQSEYFTMVVLFLGSMMGLVFSTHLILLFLFWEITSIASWRLIGFYREKEHVLKADKSFLVTVFGALIMLIGFIMIYQQYGTFDMTKIPHGTVLSNTIVLLIMFGILSKSATLPLHTWLPDAGVAPAPVTSLLHAAVLVKIGVYVFARLFVMTFSMDVLWHTVVPIIAGVSALVSAGVAILETDLKRIIAYSTVSQIGFIFLGLSTGSMIGITGGLLYILMHGLAKGGLFLCAGIIEQNAKTKDIRKMGGLITTMPLTAFAFITCAFSIMGIPPFGGFFSKYMVISGTVESGQPVLAAIFIFGAILTAIYLLRLFITVFMGEIKINAREGSATMLTSVILLAFLSLAGGILVNIPLDFIKIILQGGNS
jgi:NADH:ubiquinone oxidoreductase subunit 5 (subunit L)/multisubunit Na+/H+ antiporter MnhA subunit